MDHQAKNPCLSVVYEFFGGSPLFSVESAVKRFEGRDVLGRRREPMSLLRSWKIKGDGATTKISPLTGLPDRCRRTRKSFAPWKMGWPNPLFLGKLRLPALPALNAGRRVFLSRKGCGQQTVGRGVVGKAQLHDLLEAGYLLGAGVANAKPLVGWSPIVSQGGSDPGSGAALDSFRPVREN